MLKQIESERVARLWSPQVWPDFADAAYGAHCQKSPFQHYVDRIRHLGLAGGALIDAGCGTGCWSFAFATQFDWVLGFDYRSDRIDTAIWLKERFDLPGVEFFRGDIRQLSIPDASADVIYSNSVAIGDTDLSIFLGECFLVLKSGGICYIGLNGPRYAYYLASLADPAIAVGGRNRIYNDYCQSRLAPLALALAPAGELNARLLAGLAAGGAPVELLAALGAERVQVEAAGAIRDDLGPAFVETLARDLEAIAQGRQQGFAHARSGRGYEPAELRSTGEHVGFGRFEWALDGCLSLQSDGAIRKGRPQNAKVNLGEFEGRLRVYEALMWKPGADADIRPLR